MEIAQIDVVRCLNEAAALPWVLVSVASRASW